MLTRIALIGLLALSASAYGQGPGPARGGRGPGRPGIAGMPPEARLVGAFAGAPGQVVKNAPYSAEMITETTQILADGNRIRQVSRGKVYRDSEGRVRTEQAISGLGALAPKANLLQVVFIHDPVASVNYALNPADRTATKSAWTARGRAGTASPERPRDGRGRGPGGPEAAGRWRFQPPAGQSVKTEDLGRQTIEGVPAEGSRTTMTIPAGQIGNEQPIQIVTERWFSPDLNTVVLFKHSDPRTGETLYRLAGINRAEPAAAMFQPPADYSVKDGPAPEMPLARPRR